jgi:ABC-2 type transport system ATP-binding protein
MIQINNLSKKYGSIQALNEVSLKLEAGHIIGLCGPNGAGKTTLIKILTGLIKDYQGEVNILNQTISKATKAKVAYLPDVSFLEPKSNALQARQLYIDMFEDFDAEKFDDLLDRLSILPTQRFNTLSKGMKEKLQLALTMSRQAEIYILDEPIGGVDPAARELILNTILDNYNPSSLVLLSTHLIGDIEHIFDQVIFLKEGAVELFEDSEILRTKHGMSIDQLFREVFKL